MSYFRRPLGDDGPITDPSQVDDSLPPGGAVDAGDVHPTRVPCDQLPEDSPFRRPGQVCGPLTSSPSPSENTPISILESPPRESIVNVLLVVGGAVAAYYLLSKRKSRRS